MVILKKNNAIPSKIKPPIGGSLKVASTAICNNKARGEQPWQQL